MAQFAMANSTRSIGRHKILYDSRDWMRNLILIFASSLFLCACAKSFDHDPKLAARRAEEFAQATFVNRDIDGGYRLLADNAKRYVPLEKFKETVVKLHPGAYPNKVTATDYEPMAGETAIYVYLTGENDGEHFYYTLTLNGTAATDYKVVRFSRGSSAFGSTSQKQPVTR